MKTSAMITVKNCELCGSDFDCKGLMGCWCRSVKVPRDRLAELAKRASDCICPSCLIMIKKGELKL